MRKLSSKLIRREALYTHFFRVVEMIFERDKDIIHCDNILQKDEWDRHKCKGKVKGI